MIRRTRLVLPGDAVDAGVRRAAMRPGSERVDALGGAAEKRLDAAVGSVADPAIKAEFAGSFHKRPAEADALHATMDDDPARDAGRGRVGHGEARI